MSVPNPILVSLIVVGILLFASVELLNLPADIVFGFYVVILIVTVLVSWITIKRRSDTQTSIPHSQQDLSDVTKELEDLRLYQRQMLMDLPLGVCAISEDDEITMWNRALEKMTGIPSEIFTGKKLTELNEPWLSLLHNFLIGEYTHIYKQSFELDGKKRTVNLHKSVIENETDDSIRRGGTLILIEDISETEILEAGLTHSERLASIGRLAAGVAHEIGNPITGIACLAQNIRDEYQDDEIRTMAKQIIEQTDRTSKIVQSLVSFAHAGNLNTSTESEVITVKDCLDEAITLVSLDKRGKSIHFDVDCSSEIKINGDPQRLMQVLLNLISNARDASQPEGSIKLYAKYHRDTVRIEIEDDGVGIAPAIRDRIFDPFFTTKEAGQGTGLGLSLVYSIVEDLHGNIDIISPTKTKPNGGTRVVLSFPGFQKRDSSQHNTDLADSKGISEDLRESG